MILLIWEKDIVKICDQDDQINIYFGNLKQQYLYALYFFFS